MYRVMCVLLLLLGLHCGKNGEEEEPPPGERMPGLGQVCSADGWCWENPLPHGASYSAVWGTDANNIWAVGGGITKWDGTTWTYQPTAPQSYFSAVWGTDANNIWAVGDFEARAYWNGTAWSESGSRWFALSSALWGLDANNYWYMKDGGAVKWDGKDLVRQGAGGNGGWAIAVDNVYIVGGYGTILHKTR